MDERAPTPPAPLEKETVESPAAISGKNQPLEVVQAHGEASLLLSGEDVRRYVEFDAWAVFEAVGPGRRWTVESLGLNVEAAEGGRVDLLLPASLRRAYPQRAERYPLPSSNVELMRVAAVGLRRGDRSLPAAYVRRARAMWKKRGERKGKSGYIRAAGKVAAMEAAEREGAQVEWHSARFRREVKAAELEVKEVVAGLREQAAVAMASLTDLYDLARRGIKELMEGHLEGREVHGERVTTREFLDASKAVMGQVARLGLPTSTRTDAKSAVFEEHVAATKAALMGALDKGETH